MVSKPAQDLQDLGNHLETQVRDVVRDVQVRTEFSLGAEREQLAHPQELLLELPEYLNLLAEADGLWRE